jgi:hypothetical protein
MMNIRASLLALCVALVLPVSSASAQTVLAGAAVTCTDATIVGDVGVWPGSAVTQTNCALAGTVLPASEAAPAFLRFTATYNSLRDAPPACRARLVGTLTDTLPPGVYCVDATAKTGLLLLDAQGNAAARWTFLVESALTATNFRVVLLNGGQACQITWWAASAATLTDAQLLGTLLAGSAITITRGSLTGQAWAMSAVTLTSPSVTGCAVSN